MKYRMDTILGVDEDVGNRLLARAGGRIWVEGEAPGAVSCVKLPYVMRSRGELARYLLE